MKPEQLLRSLPVSLILTLVLGLGLSIYNGFQASLGLIVGGMWSTLNLWALYYLFLEVFVLKRRIFIAVIAQIKVPLLYGIGYIALTNIPLDFLWAVVGFHIPFLCILAVSLRNQIVFNYKDHNLKDNHLM